LWTISSVVNNNDFITELDHPYATCRHFKIPDNSGNAPSHHHRSHLSTQSAVVVHRPSPTACYKHPSIHLCFSSSLLSNQFAACFPSMAAANRSSLSQGQTVEPQSWESKIEEADVAKK
jgi:hypothetical protein